jgi:hypothetical protein
MAATISDNFPLEHALDRAASVRRFLGNGAAPDWEPRVWETFVRVALEFPDLLRDASRVTLDRFGEGEFIPVRVVEDGRNALLRLFAEVKDTMQSTRQAVAAWQEKTGRAVPGYDRLAEADDEVRRLDENLFRHWPSFREPIEEAPGEPLPLDEAFAEIAGVDRETWLRRVEEHKRKRKSTGRE